MSDPLELMNATLQWDDPPPRDERWERKVAQLCEHVCKLQAENAKLRAHIEHLQQQVAECIGEQQLTSEEHAQDIGQLLEVIKTLQPWAPTQAMYSMCNEIFEQWGDHATARST